MKGGNETQKNQGFTIVETLIVLAVTGFMFVVAGVYISGRQNKAMFQDSIQDVRSRILGAMSDVTNSVYDIPSNVTCTVNHSPTTGGLALQSAGGGAVTQGENQNCVYLGKVLSFGVNNDNKSFVTDVAFGRRIVESSGGRAPENANEAFTTIANGIHYQTMSNIANLSQGYQLRNGLEIQSMCAYLDSDSVCSRIAGVAILISPHDQISYDQGGQLNSGSLSPKVVALRIPGSVAAPSQVYSVGVSKRILYEIVDRSLGPSRTNPTGSFSAPQARSGGIRLCFVSGSTNQSGLIVIGANNQGLTADLTIKENKTCA